MAILAKRSPITGKSGPMLQSNSYNQVINFSAKNSPGPKPFKTSFDEMEPPR